MLLLGCETLMDIEHTAVVGIGENYVHTPWEENVARRGVLVGFASEITVGDLLLGWWLDDTGFALTYPGTNDTP